MPESPGARNGMLARPRGVDQPPAPPPGRRRAAATPTSGKPDYPGYPGSPAGRSVSGIPGPLGSGSPRSVSGVPGPPGSGSPRSVSGIPGSPAGPPPPRGARGNRHIAPEAPVSFGGRSNPDVELSSSGFPKRRRTGFPPPPDDAPPGPGFAPPTGARGGSGFPSSTSAPPASRPAAVSAGARNAPAAHVDPRKMPPRPARPGAMPPKGPGPVPPAQRAAAPRPHPAAEAHARWQRVHLNPHLSKRWRALLTVIGVIAVLAVCGMSSWLIVLDEQKGVQAQGNASPKPSMIPVDISSRELDPKPLTVAEVFPNDTIIIDPSKPNEAYKIIAKQEQADCRTSTKGEVSTLIQGLGCSQVIRATMRSPSEFLVTGGILNLDTVASAEKAWESIRGMVATQKGGFLGYAPISDKTTRPLVLAATVVGWNMKGHYLAFCVIARSDGKEIPDRDPFASQIMYDIVEIYLKGQILEARATDPAPPDASGVPSAKPSG